MSEIDGWGVMYILQVGALFAFVFEHLGEKDMPNPVRFTLLLIMATALLHLAVSHVRFV